MHVALERVALSGDERRCLDEWQEAMRMCSSRCTTLNAFDKPNSLLSRVCSIGALATAGSAPVFRDRATAVGVPPGSRGCFNGM